MKKIVYFGFMLTTLTGMGCASSKYHVANYEYNNLVYYKASQKYAAYLKHHSKPDAIINIADCYNKMHDFQSAERWYSRVMTIKECKPEHKLVYAKVLKANGKYELAKQWYGQYLQAVPTDKVAMAQMTSCDSIGAYTANAASYRVELIPIKGNVNSFGITPFEAGFVFCAEKFVSSNGKKNTWDGRPYLNMLYSERLPDGRFTEPISLSESLNSPYHNGPVAFNRDCDRVYFSGSNQQDGKLIKNADKVNNIKLYAARREGNDWKDITELPFNSNDYSCGHPSLTITGDTLFFISDKPGGSGSTDIYMSVNKNGTWGASINLGTAINTPGSEMFPFYYQDKTGHNYLYFSSDGLPGMGGLDIYRSELMADGSWSAPYHLGAPFNSSKDDFDIMVNASNETGYFSSSREDDKDKLFMYSKVPDLLVKGTVYNRQTKELIVSSLVEVYNSTTGKKDVVYTDKDGKFSLPVARNADYTFNASKENFVPGYSFASTTGEKVPEVIDVRIDIETGFDVSIDSEIITDMPVALSNVYFDLDKWDIRNDGKATLIQVVEMMGDDPEMKLEIDAHADSRGTNAYNMTLSQKRVNSVVDCLVNAGIPRDRIVPRWFGKLQLVNDCGPGVDCPPEMHQMNRRVEFKQIHVNPATANAATSGITH